MKTIDMKTIEYFNEIQSDDITYSVDYLMVYFYLNESFATKSDEGIFPFRDICKCTETSNKYYIHSYKLEFENQATMNFKISSRSDISKCYFTCNPNKCFGNKKCIELIHKILSQCTRYYIHQIDIAMDIPLHRNNVIMKKDRRVLITYQTSLNSLGTQYLGSKRAKCGKVKLYDKQKEAKLDTQMTRLELTLSNPLSSDWEHNLDRWLPTVFINTADDNISYENEHFSSTNRVLIKAISQCENKLALINELDYKKKKHLFPYIMIQYNKLNINRATIRKIALNMYNVIEIPSSVYADNEVIVM